MNFFQNFSSNLTTKNSNNKTYNDPINFYRMKEDNKNKSYELNNFHQSLVSLSKDPENDFNFSNKNQENRKKENLKLSRIFALISCIFFGTSDMVLKMAKENISDFNIYIMISYRFLTYFLCSCVFIYYKKVNYTSVFKPKNKKWISSRIASNLLSLFLLKKSFEYIRLGLAICLLMLSPIWGNFFSILFFREKFQMKYITSCIICLFGTYIISLGEEIRRGDVNFSNSNKSNIEKTSKIESNNYELYIGLFFGLSASLFVSMNMMGSKILMKIYKNTHDLNLTVGFWGTISAFFLSFLQFDKSLNFFDRRVIIFGIINGISNFSANTFVNLAYELAPFNKISFIFYFQIVIGLLYGLLIFGERLVLLDLIGSFIIIGYNYISAKYFN